MAIGDATIVGGGVAALATAIALRDQGIQAHVFERSSSLRTTGGGLLLWTNAIKALRMLDLEEDVLAIGTAVETTEFRTYRGELLSKLEIGELGRQHGGPSVIVHRGALLELLATELPRESIHVGMTCTGFDAFSNDDVVTAHFANGEMRDADVLIGADGLHSFIREKLHGDESLRRTGQVAIVGIAEGCSGVLDVGTTIATVGAGLRFWAGPMRDGRVYWYATVKESDHISDDPGVAREQLLRLYAGWHDPIERLIDATDDTEWIRTTISDREPIRWWGRGRVTLIGDAAHPTTPDLGQGACQALESAVELARCLAEMNDAERALRTYESRRMTRTAKMTQMSWVTAMQSMVEHPVACAARDLGVRLGLRAVALRELGWVMGG
jgi:2-polyprenyl-6-methoxyphenol hydroxylase-like FAD-dependent oxidoreductase